MQWTFFVLFKDLFEDFKKRLRVGQQIRGTDLITLKSVLSNSPFSELAQKCDYFYWGQRRVSGYIRVGVFAFYKGSHIYVSKSQCEGKKEVSQKTKVLQALRNIVSGQITEYRKNYAGNWLCPLSGKNMRNLPQSEIHIDHAGEPFKYLVKGWMAINNHTWDTLEVCGRAGRSRSLKSEEWKQSWDEYHREHACLQMTWAKANMQKGARRG